MDFSYISEGTPWYIYAVLIVIAIVLLAVFIVAVLIPGIRERRKYICRYKKRKR